MIKSDLAAAELEFRHASLLKASGPANRRDMFEQAYAEVFAARAATMPSDPEGRTAGTGARLVRSLVRLLGPDDDLLEVGCGRGYTCLKLAPHVRTVTGIDVTDAAVEESRELLRAGGVDNAKVVKGFADDVAGLFPPGSFDAVLSIDVYEHLHPDDADEHLRQVHAVLRPGGRAIIVTPNRATGPHDVTRQIYPEAREPMGFHLNEVTYEEVGSGLRRAGFAAVEANVPLNPYLPFDRVVSLPIRVAAWVERRPAIRDCTSPSGKVYRLLAGQIFVTAYKR